MHPQPVKRAAAMLNPRQQNVEAVHRLVDYILNRAGCGACGRLAVLRVDFLGDPPDELGKLNVISYEQEGF